LPHNAGRELIDDRRRNDERVIRSSLRVAPSVFADQRYRQFENQHLIRRVAFGASERAIGQPDTNRPTCRVIAGIITKAAGEDLERVRGAVKEDHRNVSTERLSVGDLSHLEWSTGKHKALSEHQEQVR
jgi:hypothetical protein